MSRRVVPKLRFPEFDEPWVLQSLDPHLEEFSESVGSDTELPVYSSTREGLISQREYYDGQEIVNQGTYGVVPEGYIVYRHMSDDGLFKFNLNNFKHSIAVSKEYPVFRTLRLDSVFLLSLLNESYSFRSFALGQKKGGTRTRLYVSSLREWTTALPSLAEQNRIADCLYSLDSLVNANQKKMKALSAHKKGLMQQLFPTEDETVPRLRFPGFRGEWKETTLSSVADYENGRAHEQDIQESGRYIVVNSRFVSTGGSVRKYSNVNYCPAQVDDVLMVLSDLPNGRALARCFLVKSNDTFAVNQRVARLRPRQVQGYFLYHTVNRSAGLLKYDDGINQTHLSKSAVMECPILIPSLAEQQKIAFILSSVDDHITALAQSVDTLKQHKKGLMQQLFPSLSNMEDGQ